jgi:hypothetical protein
MGYPARRVGETRSGNCPAGCPRKRALAVSGTDDIPSRRYTGLVHEVRQAFQNDDTGMAKQLDRSRPVGITVVLDSPAGIVMRDRRVTQLVTGHGHVEVRLPQAVIHQPARFDARPRGRRPRGVRRARTPARPEDDPEPDLASLRTISPEAFAYLLDKAGL